MLRKIQTNFTSGELDPLVAGRHDVKHYYNGAEKLRNVLVLPQGGAKLRPGLEYVDELLDVLTRFTGQTITCPQGGTTANANDNDTATEVQTTGAIGTVIVTVGMEGGHYTRITVQTDQVGESELDKLAKHFLGVVHTKAEPEHELRGAY